MSGFLSLLDNNKEYINHLCNNITSLSEICHCHALNFHKAKNQYFLRLFTLCRKLKSTQVMPQFVQQNGNNFVLYHTVCPHKILSIFIALSLTYITTIKGHLSLIWKFGLCRYSTKFLVWTDYYHLR